MQTPVGPYEDQIEAWRNRVYEFLSGHPPARPAPSTEQGKKLL